MRSMSVIPGLLVLALSSSIASAQGGRGRGGGGVEIQPGQECPAGMTEVRPRRCQAPTNAAPSIVDYRPRTTLVAPAHPVPRAKYPAIDFHGHPGNGLLGSTEGLATLKAAMDSLNIGLMIAAENMNLERIRRTAELVRSSPLKDRVAFFTGVDLRDVGPGWAEKAIADLEAAVAAGAAGIGEIGKGFGQSTRKADGTRLRLDDPDLNPIWAAAARLGLPVFIHTGDPQEFWNPVDNNNERWLELSLFPNRQVTSDQSIPFDSLMAERNNLFRRNPRTTFVAAHMGWHANDLGKLGRMLDEMPNVLVEVGAILYDLGRQPRAAHDFFVKYQDRILFGKDSFQPEEYPYYCRVFETRDDYFDYYRDYHAFWKLYGIDLPDEVLKKVYFGNALRITKGLPQDGWPR
jgi:predicted TIM-barrel fold metal-dependent hydrolase